MFSTGPETSVTITGLEAYSTYDVFVSSSDSWPPCTTNSDSTTGVTDEGGDYDFDIEFQISKELHESLHNRRLLYDSFFICTFIVIRIIDYIFKLLNSTV